MAVDAVSVPSFDAFPQRDQVTDSVLNGSAPSYAALIEGGGQDGAYLTDSSANGTHPLVERFSWKEFIPDNHMASNGNGNGHEGASSPVSATVVAEASKDGSDGLQFPHVKVLLSRTAQDNPHTRRAAQTLYTHKYLEEGYVKPEELTNGLYIDEYDSRSTYLFAENGQKVTTVRQIRATKKDGLLSLPTSKNFQIDPEALRLAADVQSLADLKPREVVEISGLASDRKEDGIAGGFDATLSIYSTMLRLAIEQGQKLWVQNTTPAVVGQLRLLIGRQQLHQIGEPKMYMGSVTTPIAINPQEVVRKLLGSTDPRFDFHKRYLSEAFKGIDARRAPKDILELLEANDIQHTSPSILYKGMHDKRVVTIAGLLAYTGARALPLGDLDAFHGDVSVFWGIDALTAFPYGWGLALMYDKNASIGKKAVGAAVAVPSLIAPYAYMYAKGENYPPFVDYLVAGIVTGAVAKDAITRTRHNRREQAIVAALSAPKADLEQ